MIQRTPTLIEVHTPATWQQLLSGSVTCPEELLAAVGLDPDDWLSGAREGHLRFPVRVPAPYLSRIGKGNPHDPLLRQILPLADEAETVPGYLADPLAEYNASPATGLIRKYRNRALLMVTGQCAINCRYCFRRHFPYNDHQLSPRARDEVITTLAAAPEIEEVIFSGGDPLAASDRLLSRWARALAGLPHLRRLRIHTRLPVVIPQRVDDQLLHWLTDTRLSKVMVVHVNHPAELDREVIQAFRKLRDAGVTLLNQSVILRGVNDCADVLSELSERLFDGGVLPYYLHAFDPVAGAHHFNVPDDEARQLVRALQSRLSGYLVPRLVREVPGQTGKTLLDTGMENSLAETKA